MSEKYNGIRVRWDGKKLFSIYNQQVSVPKELAANFPGITFEGELWCGYGDLAVTACSEIISNPNHVMWKNAKIMVFDAPLLRSEKYEQRMESLKSVIASDHRIQYSIKKFR